MGMLANQGRMMGQCKDVTARYLWCLSGCGLPTGDRRTPCRATMGTFPLWPKPGLPPSGPHKGLDWPWSLDSASESVLQKHTYNNHTQIQQTHTNIQIQTITQACAHIHIYIQNAHPCTRRSTKKRTIAKAQFPPWERMEYRKF